MIAVLIFGIVLAVLGVVLLTYGVFSPNGKRGVDPAAPVPTMWTVIDRIVGFLIDIFKGLLGPGTRKSKALRLGVIFFTVGVVLVIVFAVVGS